MKFFPSWSLIVSKKCVGTTYFLFGFQRNLPRSSFFCIVVNRAKIHFYEEPTSLRKPSFSNHSELRSNGCAVTKRRHLPWPCHDFLILQFFFWALKSIVFVCLYFRRIVIFVLVHYVHSKSPNTISKIEESHKRVASCQVAEGGVGIDHKSEE